MIKGRKQKGARLRQGAVQSIFDLPAWTVLPSKAKRSAPCDRGEAEYQTARTLVEEYKMKCGEVSKLTRELEEVREELKKAEKLATESRVFSLDRFKDSP